MEQKKQDYNSLIGFALLLLIFLWWSNSQTTSIEETEGKKEDQMVSIEENKGNPSGAISIYNEKLSESAISEGAKESMGIFANAYVDKYQEVTLENDLLKLVFSSKGGTIKEALIKNHVTHNGLPLYLVKDSNHYFNINFGTNENKVINTQEVYFEPATFVNGANQGLSMKLKISENKFLEYRYELKPDEYMVDFVVKSQGFNNVFDTSREIQLDWKLKAYSNEKSINYENQQTEMYYEKEKEKIDYLSISGNDEEQEKDVNWIAYKQHFFSSILISEKAFATASLNSESLLNNQENDETYTKSFALNAPLNLTTGELSYDMHWYFGPNDYQILKKYDRNLKEVVNLGWGIFGGINRVVFIPIFNTLQGWIGNYGLIIILLTIIVRIIMSPLVYKSYLSSAKMKMLRPEINEINEKLKGKENAFKRQQEVMALQSKAGVSPLAGCIPALLQMPVFFALFRFFPSNIDLRQQGFLWADDLASYDSILMLPFNIPFYGDHVSLFPILASGAIFLQMKMTQGQQMSMQQPAAQEGMPDMREIMKVMTYLSPIMMLFFFNMYASGLSLYYFISSLLTVGIMLFIKEVVLNEDKIHAKMKAERAKPKKQSKFKQRLMDAMKHAQEQQQKNKK